MHIYPHPYGYIYIYFFTHIFTHTHPPDAAIHMIYSQVTTNPITQDIQLTPVSGTRSLHDMARWTYISSEGWWVVYLL